MSDVAEKRIRLIATYSFWAASPEERAAVCNGAGPAGEVQIGMFGVKLYTIKKGDLIPDTMYGLNITLAADIHDWMYKNGVCLVDKVMADLVFYENLKRIIDAHGGRLRWFRRRRAFIYFAAVILGGEKAFWADKEGGQPVDFQARLCGYFRTPVMGPNYDHRFVERVV